MGLLLGFDTDTIFKATMNVDDSSLRGVLTARLKVAAAGSTLVRKGLIFQGRSIKLTLVCAQVQLLILVHIKSDGEIYDDIFMDR